MNHTAIRRKNPSKPLMLLESLSNCLSGEILDYGCGYGKDWEYLTRIGHTAYAYDPLLRPHRGVLTPSFYDVVLCTYVLNTLQIEDRKNTALEALTLIKDSGKVFFTVRRDFVAGALCGDGVLTCKNTFQKSLVTEKDIGEFREWLESFCKVVSEYRFAGGIIFEVKRRFGCIE